MSAAAVLVCGLYLGDLQHINRASPAAAARPLASLEDRWSSEPVDAAWAASTNDRVAERFRSAHIDGIEMLSVECRSTICKVRLHHNDSAVAEDLAVRLPSVLGTFKHMRSYVPRGGGEMVAFGLREPEASRADGAVQGYRSRPARDPEVEQLRDQ
jgi:hypothetical protein